MRDHVGEASLERERSADLRVALLAAVDDVLSRHRGYAGHSGDEVEILPDVEQVCRRLPQLVVKAGEVRSILSPARLNPRLVTASYEAMVVALHGETSVRMLCTTDLADDGATARFAETATTVGAEVRACVGLPDWLTIIGGSAIVVPRDPDDLDSGAVVIRTPGAVAVAGWAFEQAWRRASPAPARVILSERDHQVLECLVNGLKDELAARNLKLSVRTYRRHVTSLCNRLDATSRFEAGAKAALHGLIPPRRAATRTTPSPPAGS
jgi:DNA-binding CsgD family transcriptional regulator